jgi:hypothetical protein
MLYEDEYRRMLAKQNNGESCLYCGCRVGHFGRCILLNKVFPTTVESDMKEKTLKSLSPLVDNINPTEDYQPTQTDTIILHALGVSW